MRKSGQIYIKGSAVLFAFFLGLSTTKADDFIMDTSGIGHDQDGTIRSDQFLELGGADPNALRMEGDQALRSRDLDRAITVLQRAVELAPLDIDNRILYAEALEKKLLKQKDKSPVLYNFTVKQWLFVAKKSEFMDQTMQGLQHLVMLTGTQPKRFEKEPKFLARVLLPEDGSVKVALGEIGGDKKPAPAKKKDDLE